MSRRGAVLLAVLGTIAVLIVGSAMIVGSGAIDVASSPVRSSWVDHVLAFASSRSIHQQAGRAPAPPAAPGDSTLLGAAHYGEMCVSCHGAPGVDPGDIGQGLNPRPPRLDKGAQHWTDAELFWIVKHGIRMTGMPGIGTTHPDTAISAVVAFVRQLPRMSPSEYRRLTDSARTTMGGVDAQEPRRE